MSRFHKILALSAFIATISGNNPRVYADRTYGDVPNPDTRQLREFTIKGQKIMAYSRKDAITRLKHQKK